MTRVARVGAWCTAGLVASCIAFRAAGIDVRAGPFLLYCIVMFATGLTMDFLERRAADPRTVAGVVAAGTTIMFWALVQTADLEVEHGVYVVLFAVMSVSHYVWLRRRGRRARRRSATPRRHRSAAAAGGRRLPPPAGTRGSSPTTAPHRRDSADLIVMTEHGCVFRRGFGGDALPPRTAATVRTAQALYGALSAAAAGTAPVPGSPFDPAVLAGRTAGEVLDALVEAVGGHDAEASRRAVRDAVSGLLERFPDADLLGLSEEQILLVVEDFAANDWSS